MATGQITVDEGTTTNLATNTITEDAVTKHIPRSTLAKSDGTEIGVAAAPVQVSLANTAANATAVKTDSSATTQPVSASALPLPTGAATAAKQPALGTAGTASTDVITIQGIASGTAVPVTDNSGSLTVDNNGTFAVQAVVAGDVAHDAVDSGNPIKVGGFAATSLPAAVASGDRVNALFSKTGKQIVRNILREQQYTQITTITSSTGETTIATADATYFLDLYGLVLTNTSATATKVTLKDATAGTTRLVFQVPATSTVGFMLSAADGHKQAVVNNNWTATCGTSVADLVVTCFINKNL